MTRSAWDRSQISSSLNAYSPWVKQGRIIFRRGPRWSRKAETSFSQRRATVADQQSGSPGKPSLTVVEVRWRKLAYPTRIAPLTLRADNFHQAA